MPTALSAISEDSSIDARLSARTSSSRGNDEDHSGYTAVSIRVRPLDPSRGTAGSLTIDSGRGEIWRGKEKFAFASVFGDGENNEQLFEVVGRPLVDSVMLGYNGTILAYGQTGSGKTYTMEGDVSDDDKRGLLPRMVCAVFDYMENSGEHMQFMINVQFLEIYNEKIRDLLAPDKDNLKIRELKSGDLYVEGASQHYITSELEVAQALEAGAASRATAETYMNQASSRLH